MALADAAGKLTEEGLLVLVSRLQAVPGIPDTAKGEIIGQIHAHRALLIGLSRDVVIAAINAIRAGKTEDAQALILGEAKQEALLNSLLGRAEERTGRAAIRGKASAIFKSLFGALLAIAMSVAADAVLDLLSQAKDG